MNEAEDSERVTGSMAFAVCAAAGVPMVACCEWQGTTFTMVLTTAYPCAVVKREGVYHVFCKPALEPDLTI